MQVLPQEKTYSGLYEKFQWRLPERYNIGVDICDRWAKTEPGRIALIHKNSEDQSTTKLSYGELAAKSNQLANALTKAGMTRTDRVALLLPQSPQTALCHIATYKLGGIVVPLALLFGLDALEYRLNNCGAKALVTNAQGLEKIRQISSKLPGLEIVISVDGPDGDVLGFDDLIAAQNQYFEPVITSPDDPALMVYTSGTTGPPKGALHGHRVLLGHCPGVEFSHEFFPQPEDVMWTPADWAWAGGIFNILFPGLRYGAPVVSYHFRRFDPEAAFGLMEEYNIRNCFIPPTALKMLRVVEAPAKHFKLNLRTISSGGESLGREVYEWSQQELGLTVNEFYGQTECNYVLASCAKLGISKPGAIGRPVPGHIVGVIDEEGNILPPGEQGQIAMKRPDPVMFLGYWDNPEATKNKFIGDWLTTGDQGIMDEDGYVSFVGRDDDVITSAGFRIGPGEIEDCLLAHEAVALSAAIGKPDDLRTEIVKAFIVLKDGYEPSDNLTKEIQTFVKQRLSAHEYPREIAFVDSLPLTTSGKVIRRLLREQA